ncbi:HAD hydrolase family protein [Aerococcus viridans]
MIKHIFLDMDGTLLNNQVEVSSSNSQALKETQIWSASFPLESP